MTDERCDAKAMDVLRTQIQHEREMREALGRLFESQRLADKEALKLQAAEYERRLKDLNHEAARLKAAAALSVSSERYDAHREADQRQLRDIETKLQTQREEMIRVAAEKAAHAKWIAVVITLLGIGLNLLLR